MASRFGFNVTIGADTNPFAQALKKLNAPIKEAQNELTKLSKALKIDPTNATLIANKHSEIATEILEEKKKVEALKEVLKQLDDEYVKNNGLTEEQVRLYRSTQNEIEISNKNIKDLTKEYKNFGSVSVQQIARCWLTNGNPRWKDRSSRKSTSSAFSTCGWNISWNSKKLNGF